MTKKHFQVIAGIIAHEPDASVRRRLAWEFVHLLRELNPWFDRDKFLAACNVR